MRDQRVYLNSVSLTDAHPLILLQHIEERAPEWDVRTGNRAGAPGQFVTSAQPSRREIAVAFAVREALDFARRAEAIAAAAAWMRDGGWLELSSRPNLRIHVTPTQFPGPGRLRDWTQDIQCVLTAYEWPLWSEAYPSAVTLSSVNSGTAYISVPGTWETRLEAVITPKSTTLTSCSIAAGGQTLSLSGLSVTAGTPLKIWWDERHLLRIEAGGTGLLGKRTGDDLALGPGRYQVSVTCSASSDVKLTARGCYL